MGLLIILVCTVLSAIVLLLWAKSRSRKPTQLQWALFLCGGAAVGIFVCVVVAFAKYQQAPDTNSKSAIVQPDAKPSPELIAKRKEVLESFVAGMNSNENSAAVRLNYATSLIDGYGDTPAGAQARAMLSELQEEARKEKIGDQWRYTTDAEAMGRGAVHTASVTSSTSLNLDFPYKGEQWPVFAFRSHPKYGRDAILMIDEGQILCHSYSSCTISISFDGKPPKNYEAYGAADNSTTTAFIRGHDRIIQQLAGAKEMKVQFPLYQNGEPVLTFNVEGFKREKYQQK